MAMSSDDYLFITAAPGRSATAKSIIRLYRIVDGHGRLRFTKVKCLVSSTLLGIFTAADALASAFLRQREKQPGLNLPHPNAEAARKNNGHLLMPPPYKRPATSEHDTTDGGTINREKKVSAKGI
ncbi:hypothetical protein RUND412_011449 [Rhizina undulata]